MALNGAKPSPGQRRALPRSHSTGREAPPGPGFIRRIRRLSTSIVVAAALIAMLGTSARPACAAGTPVTGTPSDQLITQEGSGAPTASGDFVAAAAGGLDAPYSYWLEVPAGLARLVVEIFDADVGAGGATEQAQDRDRLRGAADTSVEYRLFDPSGAEVTTNFTVGNQTSPAGADGAWLVLYDSASVASFAEATTASNAVILPPVFESVSTATSLWTSSLSINVPAGTAAGDLLVAVVATRNNHSYAPPAGWIQLNQGQTPGNNSTFTLMYRVAGASEPASYAFTWTGGRPAAGGIIRYSGADPANPFNAGGVATGTGANPTAPSATTTVGNTMVLRAYGADAAALAGSPYPPGTTGHFDLQAGTGFFGIGFVNTGAADALQTAAGPTGNAAFSKSASVNWRAATAAIQPSVPAPTSLVLATPAATASGDLLIATVSVDGNLTITPPAGWSSINQGQSSGNSTTLGLWYRVADGTEAATYSFSFSAGGEAAGAITRYVGVDTSNPIAGSSFAAGNDAAPTAPSVGATNINSMVLRVLGSDTATAAAVPAGTSERFNLASSAAAGAVTTAGADLLQAAAGATGTAAFTLGASQPWRAGTVVINSDPSAASIPNGHWELRVDMSSAVTSGDDVNAFGFRAHDGDAGAGGNEINAYVDTFTIIGVNDNPVSRDYRYYPYVTSGCELDLHDFDFDSIGSYNLISRSGDFSLAVGTVSGDNVWSSSNASGWTALATAADYGLWDLDFSIGSSGAEANYGPFYVGSFTAAPAPPSSQPEAGSFRMYLPADDGGAPAKPYLAQYLTYVSGDNPPTTGNTSRYTVTVVLVNPGAGVGFDAGNLVTAWVPGGGVTYAVAAAVSQGSIVSQPALGGSGSIQWNPGTVGAGGTALMYYQIDVVGTGGNVVVSGAPGSGNGTRASYRDHTGNSSQGRATVALGELCQLTVDGVSPTHTLVSSFETYATAGGVTVEWTTAAEAGTVGFELLRFDEQAREWVHVNAQPLPSVMAPQGGTYRLLDPEVSVKDRPTYMLIEHESSGRRNPAGPFMPEIRWDGNPDPPAGDFERAVRPSSLRHLERAAAKSQARAGGRLRPIDPAQGLKIAVRETGMHRVGAADIAEHLGLSVGKARQLLESGRLALTNRGEEVAWRPADDGGALEFYGLASDSVYTRDNIYRLALGTALLMERRSGAAPSEPAGDASFRARLHFEKDIVPGVILPLDPEGDIWFWDRVVASDPNQRSAELQLLLNGVAASSTDPQRLTVRLQGASAGEHELSLLLNGSFIDTVRVVGTGAAVADLPHLPPGALVEGDNRLVVRAESGVVAIDSVSVEYERSYRAERGRELLHPADGRSPVTVSGFDRTAITVFDVSDPLRPVEIADVLVSGGGAGGFSATYEPPSADATCLALTPQAIRSPAWLTPDAPSKLLDSSNRADYLIITTAGLLEAAQEIAAVKERAGLETMVVDLADIYDEANHGIADPNAIRSFLRLAVASWSLPPRYVLLAGAGSWDFRDNLGHGGNLVPPLLARTDEAVPSVFATDALYADLAGDDGVPEIAVGRLPAVDAGELAAYAAKIAGFESAAASADVLMLADNPDRAGDFPADSDRLLGRVPAGYTPSRIYLSELSLVEARARLFDRLRRGTGLVNYLGHGGIVNLAHEGLLTADDLPVLEGLDLAPVISTFSCYIGYFAIPGFDSLGEQLVLAPDGGAAAVVAPNYLSQNAQARVLNDRFLREVFRDEGEATLGEAFRRALAAAGGSVAPGTLLKYGILGDPALGLRLAPGEVSGGAPGSPGGPE